MKKIELKNLITEVVNECLNEEFSNKIDTPMLVARAKYVSITGQSLVPKMESFLKTNKVSEDQFQEIKTVLSAFKLIQDGYSKYPNIITTIQTSPYDVSPQNYKEIAEFYDIIRAGLEIFKRKVQNPSVLLLVKPFTDAVDYVCKTLRNYSYIYQRMNRSAKV